MGTARGAENSVHCQLKWVLRSLRNPHPLPIRANFETLDFDTISWNSTGRRSGEPRSLRPLSSSPAQRTLAPACPRSNGAPEEVADTPRSTLIGTPRDEARMTQGRRGSPLLCREGPSRPTLRRVRRRALLETARKQDRGTSTAQIPIVTAWVADGHTCHRVFNAICHSVGI